MVVGSLLPLIKADWGLSDQQLGSLTSIVYLAIAATTIPLSFAVDRWSRRKMISLMVVVWSGATLACAFATGLGQLLAARAAVGLGEAAYVPAGAAMLSAAFAPSRRARVLGLWNGFIPVGAAVGFVVGGYVGLHYGWRHAFGLVALPGFIVGLLYLYAPDYRTVALSSPDSAPGGGLAASLRAGGRILATRTPVLIYLGFAMNTALTTAVLTWLPSYFVRTRGMGMQRAGALAAGLALLVLVGAPLGGLLADRWAASRPNARLLLAALSSVTAGVAFLLALLLADTALFWPLLAVFGVAVPCFIGPAYATLHEVVHPGVRALAVGFCVLFQHALGGGWSPLLIGRLSDRVGLEQAFLILPVFSCLAMVALLLGARSYERDRSRVAAVALELE